MKHWIAIRHIGFGNCNRVCADGKLHGEFSFY